MPRMLLLLPTATYRAPDFVAAATSLGVEVVVGSEARQALADDMGDRALVVPLTDPDRAVEAIAALHGRAPIDAVVAVDDQGVLVASMASARLGLAHNPPEAARATRDKAALRAALARVGVRQPDHRVVRPEAVAAAVRVVGLPVVVKPLSLSGSRGVIRADDEAAAVAAADRIGAILADAGEDPGGRLLVERFVPGTEVAVEALLVRGRLRVLALFDKPDPLDGPYFEETIYVTPSRLAEPVQDAVTAAVAGAADALGLVEGPVHAEARIGADGTVTVLELAARSIGGLCARVLRFGAGISLEEVILHHALGHDVGGIERESSAAGVMMLPIPRSGTLRGVGGIDEARAVDWIVGLEITIPRGQRVRALPEGDRYLGFLFAHGPDPARVEHALREAHARLEIDIEPDA